MLEGLATEDDGVFYGHFVHFTVFCYILWTFGIVRGNLAYFSVLVFCAKKNLATLFRDRPRHNKIIDDDQQSSKWSAFNCSFF
jgi:hypothetical protein